MVSIGILRPSGDTRGRTLNGEKSMMDQLKRVQDT